MFSLTKWMVAPVFAAGMLLTADTATARAEHYALRSRGVQITIGGGHYQSNHPSYNHYNHYNHYGSQVRTYSSFHPTMGYQSYYGGTPNSGYGAHHDTSHYDYHPTEIYRHGNHYDVQPGHYDFHQEGHYHH